jgi:hypothetical protein
MSSGPGDFRVVLDLVTFGEEPFFVVAIVFSFRQGSLF